MEGRFFFAFSCFVYRLDTAITVKAGDDRTFALDIENQTGGSGLGLAIAREIARREGDRLTFCLPLPTQECCFFHPSADF